MSLTSTQFQAVADNIGNTLQNLESSYITSPATNAAAINTGQTGASNSLISRIAGDALSPSLDQPLANLALALAGNGVISSAQAGTINGIGSYTNLANSTFYLLYKNFLLALDTEVGGMAEFIRANSLVVHQEFAAAVNYLSSNYESLGIALPLSPILPAFVFVGAETQLGQIAETGLTTGTFTAGSSLNMANLSPAELFIKNIGASTSTGTATVFTITYDNGAGNATASKVFTLGGAQAAGAKLDLSVTGRAVSNITITAGANGDLFAVMAEPPRVATY